MIINILEDEYKTDWLSDTTISKYKSYVRDSGDYTFYVVQFKAIGQCFPWMVWIKPDDTHWMLRVVHFSKNIPVSSVISYPYVSANEAMNRADNKGIEWSKTMSGPVHEKYKPMRASCLLTKPFS